MSDTDVNPKGAANGAADVDDGLLTRFDALAFAHVDSRTLQRWQKQGLVSPIVRGGRQWYDPRELQAAASDSDEDLDLVSELRKLISDLASQNKQLLSAVTEPARVFTEALNKHCEHLAQKDEKHEQKWLEVLKLTEELVSAQHERAIEIQRFEKGEKRKDDLLELAKRIGPNVVDQFILGKFRSFLSKLGPERLGFMLAKDTEFLTDDLREDLAAIVAALQRTENLKGDDNGKRERTEAAQGEPVGPPRGGSESSGGPGERKREADRGPENAGEKNGV